MKILIEHHPCPPIRFKIRLKNLLKTIHASTLHFVFYTKPTHPKVWFWVCIYPVPDTWYAWDMSHDGRGVATMQHMMKMTTFYAPYGILNKHRHIAEITTKWNQLISISLSRKYFSWKRTSAQPMSIHKCILRSLRKKSNS